MVSYHCTPGIYPIELQQAAGRLVMTWAELENEIMLLLRTVLFATKADPSKPPPWGFENRLKLLLKCAKNFYSTEPDYLHALEEFSKDCKRLKDVREAVAHGISCFIKTEGGEVPGFVRHDLFSKKGVRDKVMSVDDVNHFADQVFLLFQEATVDWNSEFAYQNERSRVGSRHYAEGRGWYNAEDAQRVRTPRRVRSSA